MFLSACLLTMFPTAGPSQYSTALAPSGDGKLLFVAMTNNPGAKGATGWVCVWDLTTPELKAVIPGVPSNVRTLQPTADGKRFVLVAGDAWHVTRLEVWDTAAKKALHSFDLPAKGGSVAAVSPDGNWVALRPTAEKAEVWVSNTDTGKRAAEVEKSVGKAEGMIAFSADSKRLVVASRTEAAEFDLATGTKAGGWKRADPPETTFHESGGSVACLPSGKGVVTVTPTGKRRQSYVVRVVTEKKSWDLGEFWDYASAPTLSSDGRLLIVSGGGRSDKFATFVLKLDADGNPELEAPPEKPVGPSVRQYDKKVVAWREWPLGEATRAGREYTGVMAFGPDGQRLFVAGPLGKLRVYGLDTREPRATLFSAVPKKDEVPDWHILTAAGEVVGSPAEVAALVKDGKTKDAGKVKVALSGR